MLLYEAKAPRRDAAHKEQGSDGHAAQLEREEKQAGNAASVRKLLVGFAGTGRSIAESRGDVYHPGEGSHSFLRIL